jgi:CarD family transcriptional regulator
MTHISTVNINSLFAPGDVVVYPGHGVGKITDIETKHAGGHELKLVVISFEEDRMTVRVPMQKVKASGLRNILSKHAMSAALATLKEPATPKRTVWRRRAVEYAAKIKSGNAVSIAEVVRDLHRAPGGQEPSYSERLLYEEALARLIHEVAAVEQVENEAASAKLESLLNAA